MGRARTERALQIEPISVSELRALGLPRPLRTLNVCGGHERTIASAGLRAVLAHQFELIPGPGCPVCVCPEEDIATAIYLAQYSDVTVVAFGDMLRVPVVCDDSVLAPSLAAARAAGADVRAVASPIEVAGLARALAPRPVVFFTVGFETTMAPVAAMVAQGVPRNVSLLVSGRRTWPVVQHLLKQQPVEIEALIAPGHVATVMGAQEWHACARDYRIPTAIAGFKPVQLLTALGQVARQHLHGEAELVNAYSEAVRDQGNRRAQHVLEQVFDVLPARWRGVGIIADSGYELRDRYAHLDARRVFSIPSLPLVRDGKMPAQCACAQVILGKRVPTQCPSYGSACTPHKPLGPCMVSDEGACRIWWSARERPIEARKAWRDGTG